MSYLFMGFNALSEIISDIWTWTDVNKDWMTIVIAIVAALATASATFSVNTLGSVV